MVIQARSWLASYDGTALRSDVVEGTATFATQGTFYFLPDVRYDIETVEISGPVKAGMAGQRKPGKTTGSPANWKRSSISSARV